MAFITDPITACHVVDPLHILMNWEAQPGRCERVADMAPVFVHVRIVNTKSTPERLQLMGLMYYLLNKPRDHLI